MRVLEINCKLIAVEGLTISRALRYATSDREQRLLKVDTRSQSQVVTFLVPLAGHY